jgi:hypothetical protein
LAEASSDRVSQIEFCRYLRNAGRSGAHHLAKDGAVGSEAATFIWGCIRAVGLHRTGPVELRVVERVEGLEPKLKRSAFSKNNGLQHRNAPIVSPLLLLSVAPHSLCVPSLLPHSVAGPQEFALATEVQEVFSEPNIQFTVG